jgi:CTP synthase (UTP-ammonia lyase)
LDVLTGPVHYGGMSTTTAQPPRLALIGDRSATVAAHAKIPLLMESLGAGAAEPIELYWLHSTAILGGSDVAGFDGVWVIPGSPYEHRDGVLDAIETARTERIPLLGTCGGFQHVLLEFARNVCGLPAVEHGEQFADADELLIVPLACSLFGEEAAVTVAAGTRAAHAMGAGTTTERFFCRYGLNAAYLSILEANGLVISGRDGFGDARLVELPEHPFFIGSLFQPELSSDSTWVHPLIAAFAAAVRAHAAVTSPPGVPSSR